MKNRNVTQRACTAIVLAAACGGGIMPTAAGEKPKAYLVSDAHLDTQWNWDIQTTIGEYVWNTINQNLFLLKKYPDYIFNFEGGVKYSWMKEYYPREYEEMKGYIKQGRWHISGASWDANDVLVPSAESLIRNILLGQDFYRKEFGVESTDIFLPDCFGFGWTLPTVASHCGLIGFSSQKLGWRHLPFHDGKRYPYTVGLWKGVDGNAIMMAHGFNYGQRWNDEDLSANEMLLSRAGESASNVLYHYYGTGDIGGSPTITSVDAVQKSLKGKGPVEIVSAASDRLYQDYLPFESHPELPVYDGELLMDVHGTGCYTSQAAMKLYNRQNELLGDAAERSAVAADLLGMMDYPGEGLAESWRRFIFHQFHDDLTGTSIPRAYEFSWNDEMLSLKQFSGILTSSVGAVAKNLDTRAKGIPVVIYNALGYTASDVVELTVETPCAPSGIIWTGPDGRKTKGQLLSYGEGKAHILVEASAPANGFAVYDLQLSGNGSSVSAASSGNILENTVYLIRFDTHGDITSITDKRNGRELVKEDGKIRLAFFGKNESFDWPAWEILKPTIDAEPVSIAGNVSMTVVEDGPLRKTICVEKEHDGSLFRQYVSVYEGALADRIDFYNEIDWRSTDALLKAEFPLNLGNERATYDIGIGTVERGNNRDNAYEIYAHQWSDLTDSDGTYGVTIMNDCKYGWDKPDDNTLRLTLLHTPSTRGGYAYQNRQDFGHHTFTYSITGHDGLLKNEEAGRRAGVLNQRLKAFTAKSHKGTLGREYSLASSDNDKVVIKALKKAENSDEYVVRVYETGGRSVQKANISFAADIISAVEADGTEKTIGDASFSGNSLQVEVTPNSIRTFKLRLGRKGGEKTDYMSVPLAYDKKCFSWDQFPGDADFEGGYAYAAELVPDRVVASGVPFVMENKQLLNGMKCEGDTLRLPSAASGKGTLYLLAASATPGDKVECSFRAGKTVTEAVIPSYSGFVGQWGHDGHTVGRLESADVAYAGTHRHSSDGNHPYEFTYMYKIPVEVPTGGTEIILPDDPRVVLFSATFAGEEDGVTEPMSKLYRTSIKDEGEDADCRNVVSRENILRPEHIIGWSGFVNDVEHPKFLVDGDGTTKWCDVSGIPSYVDFDLGESTHVSSWRIENAAIENPSYVTVSCLLQGRNSTAEEWRTLSSFTGNRRNVVERQLDHPEEVRYLRLLVVQPTRTADTTATRIYELAVYD